MKCDEKWVLVGFTKELLYTLELIDHLLPSDLMRLFVTDHISNNLKKDFDELYNAFGKLPSALNDAQFIDFNQIQPEDNVVICTDMYRNKLKKHFKRNKFVQTWREFISRQSEQQGKYVIPRVDIAMTQRCTLNCSYCNMYVPFVNNPEDEDTDTILNDIKILFQKERYVGFIHLVGGEPLMHKEFSKIISLLGEMKKAGRLCDVWVTTNGAVKYKQNDLRMIAEIEARLFITDYSKVVEKVAKLTLRNIKMLKTFLGDKVKVIVSQEKEWIDFGDPRIVYETDEEKLANHFKRCTVPYRGLRKGRFFYCNLSVSAHEAGFEQDITRSSIDLTSTRNEDIVNYDLGEIGHPYLDLCKSCSGCYTGVGETVSPTSQGKRTLKNTAKVTYETS